MVVSWTYHIDELNESQTEGDLHLLSHVLHRPNKLVVPAKQVPHQPLLLLGAQTWKQNVNKNVNKLGSSL